MEINPASVHLDGSPGDTLEAVINITPSERYTFSILGMEQKINTKIKAQLLEPEGDEKSWQVKIKSTSDKVDDLFDVLTFKTDSQYRPTITIRVYARFLEKQEPKS